MTSKLIVALSLAWLATTAWALPTVDQVQAEVRNGNYTQAESMMREVVDAKPGSARAHYLYAEILAHNGSFTKASAEAARARQIDPDIKFTQPEKFRAFEQLLDRETMPAPRASSSMAHTAPAAATTAAEPPARLPAIPSWVWIAGLGGVGFLLWRGFSRSRDAVRADPGRAAAPVAPATYPAAHPSAYPATGYGNAYNSGSGYPASPGMPAAPSASRGLLGTGLAVAGGVAAGMLVDEMLHRRPEPGTDHLGGLGPANNAIDAPHLDDAARELENRPVDFGNGSDWDSGGESADGNSNDSADDGGWT